jgi:DNA polymerase-3 subunit gamma/tau
MPKATKTAKSANAAGTAPVAGAYQVLARRLRPQTFDDVLGQEHVTRTLRGAIASGRVAHAFLLTGPRGVGKTTTARLLAKALTCEQGPTGDPCNVCSNCREITDGSAIDVLELDGASNRGIDDAREIVENVRYQPAKSRFKIYIIDEVHQLTKEAFNALLKTLEEPPAHVKFIFATTEPDRVLPTIVSRCQRYDFRRLTASELRDHLQEVTTNEKLTISPEGLFMMAREADGSVRDAQSLLEQVVAFAGTQVSDEDLRDILGIADRTVLYEMADAIIDRQPARCLELVEQLYRYGYDVRRFCRDLLEHMRNLMVTKLFDNEDMLAEVPPGETARIREQAARRAPDDLQRLFRILLQGDDELGRSLHPKLALEMTLVRLAMIEPLLPIGEITARLEALEAGLPAGAGQAPGGQGAGAGSRSTTSPSNSPPAREKPRGGATPPGRRTGAASVPAESAPPKTPATPVSIANDGSTVAWSEFLALVQRERKTLYMTLATSRAVDLRPEALTIGVTSELYARELAKPENRRSVEALATRFFGRELSVEVEAVAPGGAEAPVETEAQRSEKLKQETLEDPTVKAALDILGGEVRVVRPRRPRP